MADPMGGSAEERAANGEHEFEAEELFPLGVVDGDELSLKQLVKPTHDVTTECSLMRAAVPLRSGLADPNKQMRMLVTGQPTKLHTLPKRDDDGKPEQVTGWKVTQDVRVVHVECVPLTDRELILNRYRALQDESAQAAGSLLDELKQIASEALASA